jgi:hypothetical protein
MGPGSLWIPDLFQLKFTDVSGENFDNRKFVKVFHNGKCIQSQRLVFSVPYQFNISRYPFDIHELNM